MDEQYKIYLIGGNDDEYAIFNLIEEGDDCRLQCEYRGKVLESICSDFFEALCDIRAQLSYEGLIPLCYGASLNVYPSGMARDMGGGLKAYKLTVGKRAQLADLVEIFTEGPDIIPSFVEPQKQFFQDWLAAIDN